MSPAGGPPAQGPRPPAAPGARRPGSFGAAQLIWDYQLLGLRLGRHIDGFVDAWYGDLALSAQAAGSLPPPADLAARAAGLLARLPDAGLPPARREFLAAQLRALRCTARRLAGERVPFQAEIGECFGVEISLGRTDRYRAAHDAISGLLPGPGSLAGRVEAFRERNAVPPERLRPAARAVAAGLHGLAHTTFGLPAAERAEFEYAPGAPWNAFNHYLGGYRSVISLNPVAGRDLAALPLLVTHEVYPGHHTEHCLKEALLVTGRGEHEHAISLINTPACVIAEGIAEAGHAALLGAGWGAWTETVLREHGIGLDGALVEQVHGHLASLFPARQDAVILMHDRGATEDEAVAHLRRWLLVSDERARDMVRFLADPLWRAYTCTYVEGARLVRGWLAAGDPAARLRRLLTEPLLPAHLAASAGSTAD